MLQIYHKDKNIATFNKDNEYILEYKNFDIKNSISLSLPNDRKFYINRKNIPFFDTFLPEGYLFEIFKNFLIKEYGYIDDFLLFKLLAPNMEGRITYKDNMIKKEETSDISLEEIINNDTKDTFNLLLKTFLTKNAVSGVQPKSMAILKESVVFKRYIVKTWGDEFKYLAENEYLTMKTISFANIPIPTLYLSKNKNFLIVERFDDASQGFEEVISLMGKLKDEKYSGSYEKIAKEIYKYTNDPVADMQLFYKMVIMHFLLKNGDAHLKNFGLLYNDDFSHIRLSPSYDVVTTTAYIFKDKPALTLNGKKIWHGKDTLISFGVKHCYLKESIANKLYNECIYALKKGIIMLNDYIKDNPHFTTIGKRMIDSWKTSLDQKSYKELPLELIKSWQKN